MIAISTEAHCFLRIKEENEANTFPAELLIPDSLIYENQGVTKSQIARLAGYNEKDYGV